MSSVDFRENASILQKLCSRITGKTENESTDCLNTALRILASNINQANDVDEFQVCEKIKKRLVRQSRTREAALFTELHRKLKSQGAVQNRVGILHLLLLLGEEASSAKTKKPAINPFAKHLAGYATSTPQYGGVRQPPETPALGLSSLHSRTVNSTKSSGISSIRSGDATGPTPQAQSFAPSYLPTPLADAGSQYSDASHRPLGPRLAWTVSKQRETSTAAPSNLAITARSNQTSVRTRQALENTSYEVPESVLLREVMYIFQGIEGKLIRMDPTRESFKIDDKVGISKAMRKSVSKMAECGWLYNKIRKYVDSRRSDKSFGLVGQSFCAALHQELTEYYRMIAVLEAQFHQEDDEGVSLPSEGLTLRQLAIWTSEPLVRLKALAALVDICKGKKGGALASAVHSYLQHGDPFLQTLVKHTLTLVVQPVFSQIIRWMYDGELEDIYHEFFVASDPTVKDDRLWHDKYSLRKSMIPSFLTMEQAKKILLTGKSINFLRIMCHDRTQIKTRDIVKGVEVKRGDTMFLQDLDGVFQRMVDTVYKETSKHLLEVLHNKYKFMDHLKAMRRYLLLGQGDFIRHLMDLLEEDLAKPAATLYVHNLTGILETAIRATNAQFDDNDILKRLDVRLLEVSPGDTGWDVFSLDYHVDGPIRTVFTPETVIIYLRVFNFLWRAKRMEYILSGIWKAQTWNARAFKQIPELTPIMHQCHVIASEMIHFIQQVQYYINFEVLECSWDEMLKKVSEAGDLDHVLAAHQVFLDAIILRSLLDDSSRPLLTQLRTIFDLIIQFQAIQDNLFQAGDSEMRARTVFKERQKKKTEEGEWGLSQDEENDEELRRKEFARNTVTTGRNQLRVLSQSYQDMAQRFLVMLTGQQDVSLRFLSFRIDFNEHYKAREPKLRSPMAYQRKRTAKS